MRSFSHLVASAWLGVLLAPPGWAACGGVQMPARDARAAVDFVEASIKSAHVGSSAGLPDAAGTQFDAVRALAQHGPRARELVTALNRALVPFADAHLEVRMKEAAAAECGTLGITLLWNEAGLWVRKGAGEIPTGARVESLGGVDVTALEARVAQQLPHETRQWLLFHAARLLTREDTLRAMGLVSAHDQVSFALGLPDGTRRWVAVPLQPTPVAEQKTWFGYRLFPEATTGLFWFDRFDYDDQIAGAFRTFLREAEAAGVTKIAIDIRGNPGGDAGVAVAMLDALTPGTYNSFGVEVRPSPELAAEMPMLMPAVLNPVLQQAGLPVIAAGAASYELPPPLVLAQLRGRTAETSIGARLDGRRLFLLTDGGTFSSGTLFAALVRDNRLGEIVGEAPGNTASFNGSELRLHVPGMDYYLNLSTARLQRPDRDAPGASSIDPDVPVVPTGGDFAAGRDPVIEAVLGR